MSRERVHRFIATAAAWASVLSDLLAATRRLIESLPQKSREDCAR